MIHFAVSKAYKQTKYRKTIITIFKSTDFKVEITINLMEVNS